MKAADRVPEDHVSAYETVRLKAWLGGKTSAPPGWIRAKQEGVLSIAQQKHRHLFNHSRGVRGRALDHEPFNCLLELLEVPLSDVPAVVGEDRLRVGPSGLGHEALEIEGTA